MADFYNQNPFLQNQFLPGQVAGAIAPGGQIPGLPGPGAAPVPPQVAPPFTPAPPRPAPGAAPMQLQPQQTGFDRAMNSPWAAMAFSGLNNLAAGLQNQPMQQDPFAAYQAAVARNAELALKQRAEERAQRTADQEADPFYEYEEARRRGLIPPNMTLQEYQRTVQTSGSNRPVRTWTGENGNMMYLDSNGAVVDTGVKGSPPGTQIVDRGGVPYVEETLPGGEIRTMPLKEWEKLYRTQSLESEAAAGEKGTQAAKFDAGQIEKATEEVYAYEQAAGVADRMLRVSEEYEKMIDSGKLSTGLIDNFLLDFLGVGTQELAAMDAEAVQQTLENLQITNLAPVTENEMRTIAKLWANAFRQEEPNLGTLRRAIRETKLLQQKIQRRAKSQGERLREYGGETEYERLRRANPWFNSLYLEDEGAEVDLEGV